MAWILLACNASSKGLLPAAGRRAGALRNPPPPLQHHRSACSRQTRGLHLLPPPPAAPSSASSSGCLRHPLRGCARSPAMPSTPRRRWSSSSRERPLVPCVNQPPPPPHPSSRSASEVLPKVRSSVEAPSGPQDPERAVLHAARQGVRGTEVILGPRVSLEWSDSDPLLRLRRRAKLKWRRIPETVLVVKKWKCKKTTAAAAFVVSWLARRGFDVVVEQGCLPDFKTLPVRGMGRNPAETVDLVVVLGGDGTLLHTSRLFSSASQGPLPPCVTFGLGSLGFMANFSFDKWTSVMERIVSPGVELHTTLRTRLLCEIRDQNKKVLYTEKVLNDIVVCQGNGSGGIGKFMLFVDNHYITRVEGDGIIVSTPSGSTGYNMSCGGAMVAPSVPCTLLTPIAPSSLSFRPILINEQSSVEVVLPMKSRSHSAQVVCDGIRTEPLLPGYSACITTSQFPLPVINQQQLDHDWLDGITTKLMWNQRGASQDDETVI